MNEHVTLSRYMKRNRKDHNALASHGSKVLELLFFEADNLIISEIR